MKYFEILYKNCIDKKYVGLVCRNNIEEAIEKFPTSNGCRLIDIKETTFEHYRSNTIQHFTQYGFSV